MRWRRRLSLEHAAELERLSAELVQTTAALHRLEHLIDVAPIGVVSYDRDGNIDFVNRKVLESVGAENAASFEQFAESVVHPSDRDGIKAALARCMAGTVTNYRIRVSVTPDRWMHIEGALVPDFAAGEVSGVVAISRDVTKQMQRADALRWFKTIDDLTTDIVTITALDGSVVYLNPAGRRFLGLGHGVTWSVATLLERLPAEFHDEVMCDARAAVMSGEVWQGDVVLLRGSDRERRPMSAVIVGVRGEHGEIVAVAATFRDISERKQLEAELAHVAAHDSLTGLASRQELFRSLEECLASGESIAVLFFDLDDFKVVNDSLGHTVGDEVLSQLAQRIRSAARDSDVVGRLGGDEFLVICRSVTDVLEASEIATRILDSVRQPMQIGMRRHFATGSIGVAMSNDSRPSAANLIQEADIAMYRAKRAGRRQFVVFNDSMRVEAIDRLELEREVRQAVERAEFELYFQPLVYFGSDVVENFEALIRWNHPRHGMLPPTEFLSVVDKVGLTGAVGDWVNRQATAAVSAMRRIEPNTAVGINVDSDQIRQHGFVDGLMLSMAEAGVSGRALAIEVTEHAMMDDIGQIRTVLEQLRSIGVSVAIDDFGTGFSNLDLLRRLPVDFLKIDQSFIAGVGVEPGDSQLVRMMIGLSKELGIEVIAEGVETQLQEDELRRMGCRIGQGYLYSRPLSFDDALSLLRVQQARRQAPVEPVNALS